MISAFIKGIQQLSDKNTQKPLWISIAVAVGVFFLVWFCAGVGLKFTAIFDIGWMETLTDWLAGALVLVVTWALFPGVVSAVVALLLDQVAESVEARHYPDLGLAHGQTVNEQIVMALKFLGIMVLLNILLLPFMLLGPAYPLLFYSVNGYLLGREYFEMVAARRLDQKSVILLRRAHSGRLFLAGVAIALLLTLPVVNLLTPVVATAAMVHLFQKWRGNQPDSQGSVGTDLTARPNNGSETGGGMATRPGGNTMLDGTGPGA